MYLIPLSEFENFVLELVEKGQLLSEPPKKVKLEQIRHRRRDYASITCLNLSQPTKYM